MDNDVLLNDDDLLSVTQVTQLLHVNEKTVRRWIDDNEMPLPAEKNISGHYRIKKSDLLDFITKRKEKYNKHKKQ